MSDKPGEFDEADVYRSLGYDSELEPAVKHIIVGAKYQYEKDKSYADALQAENAELKKYEKAYREMTYQKCPECGYSGCQRGKFACDSEIESLRAQLKIANEEMKAQVRSASDLLELSQKHKQEILDLEEQMRTRIRVDAKHIESLQSACEKYRAQLADMNQNCISLLLHEERMKIKDAEIERLTTDAKAYVDAMWLRDDLLGRKGQIIKILRDALEFYAALSAINPSYGAQAREAIAAADKVGESK